MVYDSSFIHYQFIFKNPLSLHSTSINSTKRQLFNIFKTWHRQEVKVVCARTTCLQDLKMSTK